MATTQGARAVILAAAVLWLGMALIVAAFLYGERAEMLERAARSAEALVLALDGHTTRTFEAVDITLAGVAAALRATPGLPRHDALFRESLVERLQMLQPYARAIFVIGPDGRILHDTDYPATPDLPLDDRDYFRAHRDDPSLERTIARPLRSRSGFGWFLAVTRRVDEGQFRGVVVAALQPQYFEVLYSRLNLGGADVITLYHRDGTLVAHHPHKAEAVGAPFGALPMFTQHLPRASAGSYLASSEEYPFERLVSYRALENQPLVVAIRQSTYGILKPWRDSALGAVLALGALALLLAALAALFLRLQRVRDLARERSLQSEKLEALGHLTGGIAHDFANLLNVVAASLRVVAHEAADRPRVREATAVGERAIVRGTRLLEQLRTFARRQPMHVRPANLNVLLSSGIELLRQASGEGIELRAEPGAALGECLLDESELEVALVNLLVNARDAGARRVLLKTYNCTDEAKPPGWRGERAADYVCLAVHDDGRGMPVEVRRRAFEPYFSTKGEQGTGLGLAQVYGFMRQIGGEVHIESRIGEGTTVSLMFPRAPAAAKVPELAA